MAFPIGCIPQFSLLYSTHFLNLQFSDVSDFWLPYANLWILSSSLSLCLSPHHFVCQFSIYRFIFFNLTLLVTAYLWIFSVLTFANLSLVWSALNICFLDPHHMIVICHPLSHLSLCLIIWFPSECISYDSLYLTI